MRLIDADEIIKETYGVVIKDMFHMDETVDVISRKDIDNAPTIEAIPIDWLVTKAKEKVLSQGKKFYSLLDLPIVYDLIEEWRKENETN